ncbi:hypothetical protein EV182_004891 [Spiromyces aspiralis]|uniref:Uncharacterized protein n=1 Tax=Spiromyces aspiralis TaxID=68401 RepID=A0ACC1HES7_9FUNG|nr:hypothetical protein EV182_004891 [Spiromyces aspiralis]
MFLAPSTFRAMKSVGSIATSFSQGLEISNSELLGGLVTLNRFYHDLQGRLNEEHAAHRANAALTAGQLKQPARYTRFALASYGWRALYFFNRGVTLIDGAKGNSDVTCMLQYLELAPEDLIGYDFRSSEVFRSSYFVAYDRENDALVLSIRGTMSIKDMLVDLACEYEKWCGGLVHSGMKATAYWLFAKVMPQLLGYAKKQGITSIRLVGHSLGASTAAVLAILLFENRDKLRGLGIDVDALDVQAFCYGAAPCVSRNLAARYEHCIHTFVNGNDIVPRLCYGSFVEFKQLVVAAANETDNLSQRLQSTFQTAEVNQKRWRDKFDRLLKARDNLQQQKNYVYLHLPGSIYHITTDTSGSASDDADRAPHSGRRGEEGNAGDPRASAATAAAAANCHQGDISDGGSRRASEYSRRLSGEKSAQTWVLPASINDFTEVVLRSSMIYEHFPSTYEAAFVRAMQTQAEQQADDASRLSSDR